MTDRSISVELHIGDDANPSPRLASALSELASALAAEEVARHVEPPSNDDVIGFAMPSLTVGDLGLNPGGSMGICFGKTTGGLNKDGECGSYCYVNTDGDTRACGVKIWG
ncbi:MAG: hypothetical protein GYA65_14635 [Actinobacteria bacterium]|jgi:hypothetical protein|nr:hypothetical protein [Acidimicrobiaceae bacterium]MBP6487532.1 hypothetical protein [Ilumatobacteraceae bacterium]NMD25411.1 hypothetical protein [Actinomycetota bacterium]MBK9972249.1 hypothetical protein [Acidimicrobiaceae bacterium]MBP7889097.1 hypothetical protein [Ilumatobacteraceae bacterium]